MKPRADGEIVLGQPARSGVRLLNGSIESTRVYFHLANDWLANEYRKASQAIDAQVLIDTEMSASLAPSPPRPSTICNGSRSLRGHHGWQRR